MECVLNIVTSGRTVLRRENKTDKSGNSAIDTLFAGDFADTVKP